MFIFDVISKFFIYLALFLGIMVVLAVFGGDSKAMLILLLCVIFFALMVFISNCREVYKKTRHDEMIKAWESLSEEEKEEWEKVWIQKPSNPDGEDLVSYVGKECFVLTFYKNYTIRDFFSSKVKKPEIPRNSYHHGRKEDTI